jgi:hypothetical protein
VTILFDANAASNESVRAAQRELARELTRRGAEVWIADLPPAPGVNGVDDYLGLFGLSAALEVLKSVTRYDWRKELLRNDKGKVLPILANAITALRSAPEWCGVLGWDEFSMQVAVLRAAPWGCDGAWTDQEDRRTTEWLQHHGILVKLTEAGQAVQTVAKDNAFHPVRQFLDALKWDGIGRIDDWLTLYAGADATELTRAVGARWDQRRRPCHKTASRLLLDPAGPGASATDALGIWAGVVSDDGAARIKGRFARHARQMDHRVRRDGYHQPFDAVQNQGIHQPRDGSFPIAV